jgi:hypothetical protein
LASIKPSRGRSLVAGYGYIPHFRFPYQHSGLLAFDLAKTIFTPFLLILINAVSEITLRSAARWELENFVWIRMPGNALVKNDRTEKRRKLG